MSKAVVVPCGFGPIQAKRGIEPHALRRYQYVRFRCQGTGLKCSIVHASIALACKLEKRSGAQVTKATFSALSTELRPHVSAGGGTRTRDLSIQSRLYASVVGVRLIPVTLISITKDLRFVKRLSGNF